MPAIKKRYFAYGLIGVLSLGAIGLVAADRIPVSPGPTGEAPELAGAGEYAIGTMVKEFRLPNRLRISKLATVTGSLPTQERQIKVRFWYPASDGGKAAAVRYQHTITPPGGEPYTVATQGIALADAAPIADQRFPLVLMSHGFGAWDTHFSNLGETLASHGYVVASIDHGDMAIKTKSDFLISFGNVLLDRAQDQRQLLIRLLGEAATLNVDPERVALIGYSMGGYGALATAGAEYDSNGRALGQMPDIAKAVLATKAPDIAAKIDALILFAPWGGQPDSRAWTAESLSRIVAPTLIVSGNQDDIVNFKEGVSWIFDQLTGADRHMLVIREARHNIVGNSFVLAQDTPFQVHEFLTEPVWRQDRINMINQHFVTAFLDLNLKGDKSRAAYLALPTQAAGDGEWPVGFGESVGGTLAGDSQPKYWRGFQRRWALGLEMRHAPKDAKAKR